MLPAPLPANEADRLRTLNSLHLLETPAEPEFDRVTRATARSFHVPTCLFSLVDADRQWFKSRYCFKAAATPRNISFCGHAILEDAALVIRDARKDSRFADNPLVVGPPHIVFYAGQPVRAGDGAAIGTLCLIDQRPHRFSVEDRRQLADLAHWLELVIENRDLTEIRSRLLVDLDQANRASMMDPLTQLWNRRGFDVLFQREIAKSTRTGDPLALAMVDIDHFKRVNDRFGHSAGDDALRQLAGILREHVRKYDVVARVGGEEFVVLMPGATRASALRVGEALRSAAAAGTALPNGDTFTISLGVGAFDPNGTGFEAQRMLDAADRALYQAKNAGRNRVAEAR